LQEALIVWNRRYQEFFGLILISISALFLVSIISYNAGDYWSLANHRQVHNLAGPVGAWTGHIVRSLFGMASYIMVAVLAIPGVFLFRHEWMRRPTEKSVLLLLLAVSSSALMARFINDLPTLSGGDVGLYLISSCNALMGSSASYMLWSGISLSSCVILLVMFLYTDHRRVRAAGFSSRMRNMLKRLIPARRGGVSRFDRTGDGRPARFWKIPWIIKKTIFVYETEKQDVRFDVVPFPGLPQPERNALVDDGKMIAGPEIEESAAARNTDLVLHDGDFYIDHALLYDEEDAAAAAGKEEQGRGAFDAGESETAPDDQAPDTTSIGGIDGIASEALSSEEPEQSEGPVDRPYFEKTVFEKIPINQEYIIPPALLISTKPYDSESWKNEIRRNSVLLKKTLAEFGIEAEVVNVNRGPVITLYEMQIAPGIKVTRVVSLADDIAMALAAHRVRIVAPIPGKSAIGVEIPNRFRETVTLGDIVKSQEFRSFKGSLAVALGKDILGSPVMLDLKHLPHLLIAGATGSGKSVCVNSIVTSLLYNYDPNYVRFIMIDPKIVELQLYNGLPHLLTPVIIDPQMASMVLRWTMHEMERRYYLLSEMNTRDIERYNEKIEGHPGQPERLPYIVVIIDEMADLMITSKEVEGFIIRIAQKARAVGIHLVVATQRPSVDIITGIIKANFPARIAFQVAQKTDSRTIIDQNGAEKLLGRGDMLYQSPTNSFPIRIQGGFISEEEIERVVSHLCALGRPSYIDIEQTLFDDEESRDPEDATDELFQEAMKIIEESKKASASYLQRRLSIGYNRAARIIEQMEEMGYIGPQIGSKPREIFI
jgi:DNA segregation ATPase FtsK/SpoIIIE-like protein